MKIISDCIIGITVSFQVIRSLSRSLKNQRKCMIFELGNMVGLKKVHANSLFDKSYLIKAGI